MQRALKITAIASVALIAGIVFVALFDWNLLRGWVARTASEKTGREVTLDRLDVRLGLHPTVQLHGLRIANPAWADSPDLAKAEQITLTASLPALLRGAVVIYDLELAQPRIALERRGDERSWDLWRRDGRAEGAPPIVQRLKVVDGLIKYRDAGASTEIDARVATRAEGAKAWVRAEGIYRGAKVRGEATGPALLQLADTSSPYPLDAQITVGTTRARLAGSVTGLTALAALDLNVELAGQNLADIESLFGDVNVPATPPYKVAGHVRRAGGDWFADKLRGTVGDSDIGGSLSYSTGGARPLVRAHLVSNTLDFDDLGPLIGAPPKTGPGEAASPEQRKKARAMAREKKMLPDEPFDVGRWDRLDADVRFVGKRVLRAPTLPIESVDARLRLENGVLRLDPFQLGVAGGHIGGAIRLDSTAQPLQSRAALRFRNLQVAELFPTVEAMRQAKGVAHGKAELAGRGNSVARMLSTSEGRFSLTVTGGTISNLVLELLGLDAGETVRIFATRDPKIPLNCAIVDLAVQNGVGSTNALVLDTQDTLVVGTGTIDLRAEGLDLTLYPRPKDASIFVARSPLHVKGPLRDPKVRPDAGALAARGVSAVLLGLVNPLLALIPLIETGPGADSNCARLVNDARTWKPQSWLPQTP